MKNFLFISLLLSLLLCTEVFGLPACHPDYQEWLDVGQPASWDYPRQCRGDANGGAEGNPMIGYYYVGVDDLYLIVQSYKIKEPPEGPGLSVLSWTLFGNDSLWGTDFDHRAAGSPYTGYYRAGATDINTMVPAWKVREPPKGPGIDPNCPDCPFYPVIDGPKLSFRVGPAFINTDAISMSIDQHIVIGIINTTTDQLKWYDAYVIMTDGLENGSWNGYNAIQNVTPSVAGWTYYGTSPLPDKDAWFGEISFPSTAVDDDPEGVSGILGYVHQGFGAVTIKLYNEFYEHVDTLTINSIEDIHLYSPNGGENLMEGQMHTIEWTAKPYITRIQLEYSVNNGTDWEVIDPNTPNDESYDWLVPPENSTQCLVRASDESVPATNDISDSVFTISPAFQCGGIDYYDPDVCSGYGSCIAEDTCSCDEGWIGDDCEFCKYELLGDFNEDCRADLRDFAQFAAVWLIDCIEDPNDIECVMP
jgi:EGF domain-containing protein